MAQVRKFQSGGKTFKINGKTYNTSNSEDMKRLEEMASNSEYGGIAQQILANVNDAAYDNTLNVYRTSDGRVMMEGGLQNVADQFMSEGTQKATQRKDNVFNNAFKRRSGKDWINNLDSFLNAFDSKPTASSSSTNGKIKISGVSGLGGQWKYNDQGWDEADINNAAMLKELQLLEDYYNASEEDRKNKYDISGLDKRSLEAYINMRQNNPNLYSDYLKSFTADAPAMDNDDFYSTYGWFGFTQNPDAKKAADNKALKEYLATQGLDFDGAENVFYRDKDGNLMVTDAFLTNVLGGDRNGHYWLNDNWANLKTDNGNTNPYSQMRDHIIWNGRIYKQDDAAVLAELQKSGYIDANKAYDAAKAEQIMRTQWSDNPTFAHEAYDPETAYSEWAHGYKDKGLRYRTLESNLGEGRNLVGYYTNDDVTDNYGLRTERFAIIGDDGKLIQDNVDPSTIAKTTNGQYIPGTTRFMTKRLGQNAGALAGTYINGTSIDGKPSNTFFYKNPTTGEFFIQDPDLKDKQKGKAVRIPKEIAAMIPEESWEYFRTNKDAKDRLFKIMKDFTNTGFGKHVRNFHPFGWIESFREDLLRSDFRKAGLSKEQADQIVDLFNKWGRNKYYKEQTGKHDASSIARQQAFLADPQTEDLVQPVFKEGGKIEKHQYGKVLGQQGKTELKTINLQESDRKDASTGQSFGLGSKDSKQWSSLDWMELAGATADLAALGATIIDPTNIGGAIAGAAGSLTNFGVDVKRDGFQGKDLGRLALNLVLDAGTLIPVLGDGLQGAKAVSAMKKAAPVLAKAIKTGAIVGVGDAVYNTIDKIAKGESFTISDVRRIINGISGGVTLSRTGLLNQTKHRVDVDPGLTIKGKPDSGVADIKLSKEQISEVMSAPKAEQMKKLTEVLKKAGHDVDKLDLDSVAKTMKRPQWKFWKGWDKTVVPDISKGGSKRADLTPEDLAKLQRERNGFQNWFFGTGKRHQNWLYNIEGPEYLEHNVPIGRWSRRINMSPDGTTATYGERYRYRPTWAPTTIRHKNPAQIVKINSWTMPNIVSTQQFPQEMEFTENVSTVPMKRLVFKKGGVLKAQPGTTSNFWTDLESARKRRSAAQTAINNGYNVELPEYVNVAEESVVEPMDLSLINGRVNAIKDIYKGDRKGRNSALASLGNEIAYTNPMGGTPTKSSDNNFPNLSGIFADTAHLASQWGFADQMNKFGKDRAKAYMLGSPEVWNGSGPRRVMLPNFNAENRARGKYLTNLNQSTITTDPMLRAGVMKGGYDNLFDSEMDSIRNTSNNVMQQWAMDDNIRREDKKLTFQTLNDKNRYDAVGAQMGPISNVETATIKSKLLNDYTVAQRKKLYDYNTIDAAINDKKYQIGLVIADGKAKGQDVSSLESMLKTLGSDDYRQSQLSRVYAKKGAKLRSTTEQMLLDNNKIVAKAISKLSDNTMKLILKAMS